MKELSLNILDIAKNSVKAGAENIEILITETEEKLTLSIEDDACGMTKEQVESVTNPFFTTRTTRKVGMGIPLLMLAAQQTGGDVTIESKPAALYPDSHGTKTTAVFYKNSIDFTPLGDVVSSLITLIHGSPDIDWHYLHTFGEKSVELDTKAIREVLGEEISLSSYEVIKWIEDSLNEEYTQFV